MRRWLLAGAVAVLTTAVMAPSAGAAAKAAHAWWWRAETGLLGAPVPPPGVPEDGLAVETTPDGPSAVAALRYRLAGAEIQPVLVLTVADQHGDLAIQACAATDAWNSTHGGTWDDRPTYDCGTAVDGVPSEDGEMWRWEVDSLVRKRRLDVVLVPAPGVGRVTFQPPDDSSLQSRRGSAAGQDFDAPPVSDFGDNAASSDTGSPDGFSTADADAGRSGVEEPVFSGEGPAGAAAGPQEAAQGPLAAPPGSAAAQPPQAAGPLAPEAAPAAAAPAAGDSSRTVGVIVTAMAAVLMLALWRQDATARRGPGSLGRTGTGVGVAAPAVGGLGRFARPRTGAPRPLR